MRKIVVIPVLLTLLLTLALPTARIVAAPASASNYVHLLNLAKTLVESADGEAVSTVDMGLYANSMTMLHNLTHMIYPREFVLEYIYYKDGLVTDVKLVTMDSQYETAIRTRAQAVIDQVITPGMTAPEQLRVLHDWLVLNNAYGHTSSGSKNNTPTAFSPIAAFSNEGPLCEAYSCAFQIMCEMLDIPCVMVMSDSINHIWNLVHDGEGWKHVDVTFDDPLPDQPGVVDTRYFLVTPENMLKSADHTFDQSSLTTLSPEDFLYIANYFYGDAVGATQIAAPLGQAGGAMNQPTVAAALAVPTASMVLVNGQIVDFGAYYIDGNNYFMLRDLAVVLADSDKPFSVGWDSVNKAIALTSGQAGGGILSSKGAGNQKATLTDARVFLDGAEIELTAYNIKGNNYFNLRELGAAVGFGVGWDAANKVITISTATPAARGLPEAA